MPLPLVALVAVTATLTLRSDTKPITIFVKGPKGTVYWGGAGLDGKYVDITLNSFRQAGIKNLWKGMTNSAAARLPPNIKMAGTLMDALRAGLVIRYEDDSEWTISSGMSEGEQLNFIGYSYGSLLAAQTANFYARSGKAVDHLVMIASPISAGFLAHLRSLQNLKKVTVIDIPGDGIHAGISQIELMNPKLATRLAADMLAGKGEGHFYYAHDIPELKSRTDDLSKKLAEVGLQ
jgi:hypothetical protein